MRHRTVDWEALRQQTSGRCFICEFLSGNPDYRHHLVYEDEKTIAFLNKYPSLHGHVLVAPREHLEEVTGDFTSDEYVRVQRIVHRVGEAIREVMTIERLYV